MATGAVPTGLATLLPPECTDTALDFRRALRRNRTHIIRLSIVQDDDDRESISNAASSPAGRTSATSCGAADITLDMKAQADRLEEEEDDTSPHHPTPLNLPLPALARIVHYFSTSSSWLFTSWKKPNLDVVSAVLAEDARLFPPAANADALLCAMDFPGFAIGLLGSSPNRSTYGWQSGPNENHTGGDSSIRSFLRLFAAAIGTSSRKNGERKVGGANDAAVMTLDSLVDRAWAHSPEGQLDLILGLLQMDRRCTWAGNDRNDSIDADVDGMFWRLLSDEEREDVNHIISGSPTIAKEYGNLPNPIGLASAKVLHRLLQFPDHVGMPSLGEKIMKFLFGAREGEPGVLTRCPEALICSFTRLDRQFMAGTITLRTRGRRFMIDAGEQLRFAYFWPIQKSTRIAVTRLAVYRRLWEVASDEVELACMKLWHAVVTKDGGNVPADRTMLSIAISHISNVIQQSTNVPAAISTIIDGKKDFEYQMTVGMFLADALVLDLSEWLVNCAKIPKSGRLFVESTLRFVEREFVRSRPRKDTWKDGLTILSLENLAALLYFLPKSDVCLTRSHAKKHFKRLLRKCLDRHGRDRNFIRTFKRSTLPMIEEGGDNDDVLVEENDIMCFLESPSDLFQSHPLETIPEIMECGHTWHTTESPAKKKWSSPTSVKDVANISASCSTPVLVNAENSLDAHNFSTAKKNNVPINAHALKKALALSPKNTGGLTNLAEPIDLSFVDTNVKSTLEGILVHIDAAADRLMAASLATAGPEKCRGLCLAEIPRGHLIKGHLLDAALYVEKVLAEHDPEHDPNVLEATEHEIGLFAKTIFDKLYEEPMHSEPFRLEVHVGLLELILEHMPKMKPSLITWTECNNAETRNHSKHHAHVVSLLVRAGLIDEGS